MQWRFPVVFPPNPLANLPMVLTREISGDKQMLPHIRSVVHRFWHSPFRVFLIRRRLYYIMCAWLIFWMFSFCIHLFLMRRLLRDQLLLFKKDMRGKNWNGKNWNTAMYVTSPNNQRHTKYANFHVFFVKYGRIHMLHLHTGFRYIEFYYY